MINNIQGFRKKKYYNRKKFIMIINKKNMLLIQILICLSIKLKFVSVENTFLGPRSSSQSQKKEIHGRWSLQIECSYAKRNHPYLSKPLKEKTSSFSKAYQAEHYGA